MANFFKKVADVFVTRDYNLFKTIDGNRLINELHVAKLAKSMLERQLAIPIIVNEKYEIIDGQHRYTAVKKHKLPLYFQVCRGYNLSDVHRLNENQQNWSLTDFLEGYIKLGKKDYIKVKEFKDKWNVPIGIAVELLSTKAKKDSIKHFRSGKYEVENLPEMEVMMKQIKDFSFFSNYKTNTFIRAFQMFSASKKYNHDVMKSKIAYKADILAPRNKITLYLDLLSALYNFKQSPSNKIFFDGTNEI